MGVIAGCHSKFDFRNTLYIYTNILVVWGREVLCAHNWCQPYSKKLREGHHQNYYNMPAVAFAVRNSLIPVKLVVKCKENKTRRESCS